MEAIFALIAIVAALLALDFAALEWGVDSRPGVGDTYRQSYANGEL